MAKRAQPYVPGEQVEGPNILKLNTNENPYPPSPKVYDAIKDATDHALKLYPSPTVDVLREAIAQEQGVSKEHVFVGNGSDEVLAFSFMAFFEPGKMIRFPNITYSFYPVYATLFDIPFKEVPLQDDFTILPESFFQSEGGVIFPNPNAPTSLFLPLEKVETIIEQNSDHVVIIDEAYVDFASSSAVSLTHTYDNVLIIQTLSKSRSLAGLRVGYAIGNPELMEGLSRIKDSINSYTIDRIAMAAATAAIQDEAYTKQLTTKIIQTRTSVTNQLEDLNFEVLPSQTNFVFATHSSVPAQVIYEKLKEQGILIRFFNTELLHNHIRITIGKKEEMNRLFTALKDIIDKNV